VQLAQVQLADRRQNSDEDAKGYSSTIIISQQPVPPFDSPSPKTSSWQCVWNEDAPFYLESACTQFDCNFDNNVVDNRKSIYQEYLGLIYCLIALVSGLLVGNIFC
jgi:hypothetical protein